MNLLRAAAPALLRPARQRPEAPGPRPARRLRWILGLAAAAIALTAGAIPAVAAVTTSPVTYYACVTNSTGAIKIVSATATCGTSQHKISWNDPGPPGPPGVPGPPGPPGVVAGYASLNQGSVNLAGYTLESAGTLALPAGTYLVNVTAMPYNNNPTDQEAVWCGVWDGNGGYPLNSAEVTLPAQPGWATEESMAITAATTAGGTMNVDCEQDSPQTDIYVTEISITATPVSTLQASGLAARAPLSGLHEPLLPQRLGRVPRS